MRSLKLALLICALYLSALALSQGSDDKKKVFDLSTDFSVTQSPEGLWQYGYSIGNSLTHDAFKPDTFLDKLNPICFWHPATNDRQIPGYYPYVAYNGSKQPALEPTHGWAIGPGEVAMEASNNGQYSIVRFRAPYGGRYRVTARFEGVHFRLSSTDVHVLHNAMHLFDAEIDGYGGNASFHPIEGPHPTASFEAIVSVSEGDDVDFAVGYGPNKTNYNDTTGLRARLVLQPSNP